MKKWEKEILQKQLSDESFVVLQLERTYKKALDAINDKIMVLKAKDQSQSVIYQLKYQEALKDQVQAVYDKLSMTWYQTIDEYLKDCYEDSFYSTMYALHQDGIPIVIPFDQKLVAQADAQDAVKMAQTFSSKLYPDRFDVAEETVRQISRGVAMNESYGTIARNIAKTAAIGINNAIRITRTEAHRISGEVRQQTLSKVQAKGADIVKQWDASVDKRTRPHHVELDGQQREIDQPFKVPSTGATAMYPGGFGIAGEDINCRCVVLERARWALDKSEVEKTVGKLDGASDAQIEEWAKKLGVTKEELIKASNGIIENDGSINHTIKAKNYNDFKKKYQKKAALEKAKLDAQADVQSGSTPFAPDAYTDERKAHAKKWSDRNAADKYYRPNLDAKWDELSEEEKYSVWEYTHNSNPINKSLSGYHDTWSRNDFKGLGKTKWGHEDSWRSLDDSFKKFGEDGHVTYKRVITDLTKAIENTEFADDVFLVRGSDGGGLAGLLESIMPFDDAQKYIDNGDIASLKSLLEGNTVKNHAFTSTGIATGTGFTGQDINYTIYAPKGTRGIYAEPQSFYGDTVGKNETLYKKGQRYQSVGDEAEIILQRGTSFRIKKIEYAGSAWGSQRYNVEMEVVDQPNYFKHGDEETFNDGASRHTD